MPAYFTEGFMVRKPAWHGLGVVLDDYPGREEAQRLAGHDFIVTERKLVTLGAAFDPDEMQAFEGDYAQVDADWLRIDPTDGWKSLVKECPGREGHGTLLHVAKQDYGVIQNDVGWDIIDAMVGEGANYETGLTLRDGAVCSVLAWLDEPVTIPGDDSLILPYLNASWAHDGTAAFKVRPTSVRVVCWNTQSAAEAQGLRTDTEFTFRHSKNVMARIEDAKLAIRGVRAAHEEYVELARELAEIKVTKSQREMFVSEMLPMPPEALISPRVKQNVEDGRTKLRGLFAGPSVPEAHALTGYGLHLAGGEYLDHLRGYRNEDTRFGRQMLRREPAKAKMTALIREVAAA